MKKQLILEVEECETLFVWKFQFDEEVLYMNKSISRIIGVIMLIVAFVFIMFALNHPEKSFPWNNTITWLLYGVYFLVTVVLLIAPKIKKWKIPAFKRKNQKFGEGVWMDEKENDSINSVSDQFITNVI